MNHPDVPLRGIDHVRFFVGNARQSAYFYRNAFGFDVVAYAGLETKSRHEAGYVLKQGNITFVLASPLGPNHPESQRIILHGDGVQDAFHDDDRVFTISLHERARWPFTGAAHDRAGGAARNFPLPAGCNDSEFAYTMNHAVLPLIEARRPQAIMLQAGADGLDEDPLAKLSLSNNTHRAVVQCPGEQHNFRILRILIRAIRDWRCAESFGINPKGCHSS